MTSETTPEMLEMARRIAAEIEGPNKGYQYTSGERDEYPVMLATLAAIKETTERAAKTCDDVISKRAQEHGWPGTSGSFCGTALRNGEHYHDR